MNKFKIKIQKSILILLILSFVLNIFRIILFGKFSLIYVLWNLFLALIPFVISSFLLKYYNEHKINKLFFIASFLLWVLFIPNAPYVITDLIHIGEIHFVPVLYDSVMIFSSALAGLIMGMYSLSHIEYILKMKYSQKISSLVITTIIFFISFGIYIGRFLRFNSWDIFERPFSFMHAIGEIFTNRNYSIDALFYTLLFFFFISMSYYSWKYIQKND